jgi:glutamine amidotransferase
MIRVGIVDYGLGNLASVAGAVGKLGHEPVVTSDADALYSCDKLILPGVGAFGDGMANLRAAGLDKRLAYFVADAGKPILGICLGAQLMTRESEEFGNHEGLGWIDAHVRRLTPNDPGLRVPHVGWNEALLPAGDWPLFEGVPADALFYFVHSFGIQADDADMLVAHGQHGHPFIAAFQKGRIFGTQFHPEKSQRHGLAVLRNFLEKV